MNRQGCLKLYPQITITKTSNRGKNIFFQFLPFLSSRKKNGDYFITWHARFTTGLIIALFDQG